MSLPGVIDITIHSVKVTLNTDIRLNIIWKRRNRRVETRTKVAIPAGSDVVSIEQTLSCDESSEKTADLYLQALVHSSAKVIGKLTISLTSLPHTRLQFPVKYCPDTTAYILISVTARSEDQQPPETESSVVIERPTKYSLNKKLSLGGKLGGNPSSGTKSEGGSKEWGLRDVLRLETGASEDFKERVEELEKEIEMLTDDNKEMKKKLKTYIDDFRRKEENLESQIQYCQCRELEYEKLKLARALERSEKEITAVAQVKADHSQISIAIYQQTISDITKKLQSREVELVTLRQELRTKQSLEEQTLTAKVTQLQSELEQCKSQCKSAIKTQQQSEAVSNCYPQFEI